MPPQIHHLYLMLTGLRARIHNEERGATAVEWVIITALLIALASGVALIVREAVTGKAEEIKID